VDPVSGGDPWKVFDFINVGDNHKLLVLTYIISNLVPDIPHPIVHPHGPQGSGKTCLCNIIKKLVDPSSIEAIISPRDPAQLIQVIAHHHVAIFDNLSNLPDWMSDILAQACTGGGFSKRMLYSDDEDIIYKVKRCIGINGINLMISKPDLMDRSILLHLGRIPPNKRIKESDLWARFERARPGILGGMFDALSKAMAIYPTVKLQSLPRMADFCQWGYALAQALGRKGDEFIDSYRMNIERQNEEVLTNNTLAQAVLKLMADRETWDGTVKEAYLALEKAVEPDKKNDDTFPKTERSLRSHLNRIQVNLLDAGIRFRIGKRTNTGVPIDFRKDKNFGSPCSPDTPADDNDGNSQDIYGVDDGVDEVKQNQFSEDDLNSSTPHNYTNSFKNERSEASEPKNAFLRKDVGVNL